MLQRIKQRRPVFIFLSQSTENEVLALKAQTGNTERRELMGPSSRVIKAEWKTLGTELFWRIS